MPTASFESADARWVGVGPYYAMFPTQFADRVVTTFSAPNELVLDPFAGRGTAVFSAARQGRRAIGVEINPVGWIYGSTKVRPARLARVEARLRQIGEMADCYADEARSLPRFFGVCYSARTRRFLLAARSQLDWRQSRVDRTLAAILMVYLHGKAGAALSNQMRQTKAMAPAYAVRWWATHDFKPPKYDPVEFIVDRLRWRYAKGLPKFTDAVMYLGDSQTVLKTILNRRRRRGADLASLLLTSPPYYDRINYHYDQWLRLWLLGGAPNALRVSDAGTSRAKFEGAKRYAELLTNVFSNASELMKRRAVIYVRTGCDSTTRTITEDAVRTAFPRHHLHRRRRPYTRPTQTNLFGDPERKLGEIDLVLTRE